jgi:1-acyl-sn-glycerol-3-phosphate acyltransferase
LYNHIFFLQIKASLKIFSFFFFPFFDEKMQNYAQKLSYDIANWIFNLMIDIFFREVKTRGAHKIPKEGPVIFVAAPHANQVTKIT